MVGELTLDILDKAIKKLGAFEKDNEVVGVAVNPKDLDEVEAGTTMITGISNKSLVMIPPYKGIKVYSSNYVPRGQVIPLRFTNRGINATK